MLKKLLQDSDNLEKYYSDKEYRRRLVSSSAGGYYFLLILQSIFLNYKTYMSGIEKLNLPENSTIKHENVRCRKDCKYNTHYYYHAYFWDCASKKLKKNI